MGQAASAPSKAEGSDEPRPKTPETPRKPGDSDALELEHARLSSHAASVLRARLEEGAYKALHFFEVALLSTDAAHALVAGLRESDLRRVSISGLRGVSYVAVAEALSHCESLVSLGLCADLLEEGDAIVRALTCPPTLEALELAQVTLSDDGLAALCAKLRGLPRLRRLILRGNELSSSESLAALLASTPSLRVLDLGNNNWATLDGLAPSMRHLIELRVFGNTFMTHQGLLGLATIADGGWMLQSLNISSISGLGVHETLYAAWVAQLVSLDISKCRIGDAGIATLTQCLARGPTRLQFLNVSQNNISAAGACEFFAVVATNTTLQKLYFSGNESKHTGAAIGDMLLRNRHLRALRLKASSFDAPNDLPLICAGLARNKHLRELVFFGNTAYAEPAVSTHYWDSVAEALKVNRALWVLKMVRDQDPTFVLDTDACAMICAAIASNYAIVDIVGCSGHAGVAALLARNRSAAARARQAIVCLLCCRRFGSERVEAQHEPLLRVPMPVVVSIAQHLNATRGDPCWAF